MNNIVNMLAELTKSSFFYPMEKFTEVIGNHEDVLKHINISDCVEFGTFNGQVLLIYNISDNGRKHIKYSCSMTTMFDMVVLENAYSSNEKCFEFDYDNTFDFIESLVKGA